MSKKVTAPDDTSITPLLKFVVSGKNHRWSLVPVTEDDEALVIRNPSRQQRATLRGFIRSLSGDGLEIVLTWLSLLRDKHSGPIAKLKASQLLAEYGGFNEDEEGSGISATEILKVLASIEATKSRNIVDTDYELLEESAEIGQLNEESIEVVEEE